MFPGIVKRQSPNQTQFFTLFQAIYIGFFPTYSLSVPRAAWGSVRKSSVRRNAKSEKVKDQGFLKPVAFDLADDQTLPLLSLFSLLFFFALHYKKTKGKQSQSYS